MSASKDFQLLRERLRLENDLEIYLRSGYPEDSDVIVMIKKKLEENYNAWNEMESVHLVFTKKPKRIPNSGKDIPICWIALHGLHKVFLSQWGFIIILLLRPCGQKDFPFPL